jgi:hypothetical protein
MSAQHLFCDLRSMGVELSIDADGRLSFDGPDDVLTDDLLSEMRAHRDGLLVVVESFTERAAIAQYDGGLSRAEAERMALGELQCKTNLQAMGVLSDKTNLAQKQIAVPEPVDTKARLVMAMGILGNKTKLQEKQRVVPEPVEMPIGVSCPYCPSRSMIDHPGGCRCAGCGQLAWVTLPAGGIVRADFLNVDLWLTASQKAF